MIELNPINLAPRGSDAAHSLACRLIAAGALILGIVVGSRGFRDFDPALVSYAGATVFSAFGLGYRYSMWLRRPPTRLYLLSFAGMADIPATLTPYGKFRAPRRRPLE